MFVYFLLVCWFYKLEMIFKVEVFLREKCKQARQSPYLKKIPRPNKSAQI